MKKIVFVLLVATIFLVLGRVFIFHHSISDAMMTGLGGLILTVGAYFNYRKKA